MGSWHHWLYLLRQSANPCCGFYSHFKSSGLFSWLQGHGAHIQHWRRVVCKLARPFAELRGPCSFPGFPHAHILWENVCFSSWKPDLFLLSFRGIIEARFVYVFVLGILFTGTKDLLRSQVLAAEHKIKTMGLWEIFSGLILLAALLFRPHNLPVLALSLLTQAVLANFVWKPLGHSAVEVTVMHYWFGQAFFYFQVGLTAALVADCLWFFLQKLLVESRGPAQ